MGAARELSARLRAIADLVTELEPRYENTKRLAEPFRYEGDRPTDIRLTVTDAYLESLMRRAAPNTTEELMENFAFSCDFNRKAILKLLC